MNKKIMLGVVVGIMVLSVVGLGIAQPFGGNIPDEGTVLTQEDIDNFNFEDFTWQGECSLDGIETITDVHGNIDQWHVNFDCPRIYQNISAGNYFVGSQPFYTIIIDFHEFQECWENNPPPFCISNQIQPYAEEVFPRDYNEELEVYISWQTNN